METGFTRGRIFFGGCFSAFFNAFLEESFRDGNRKCELKRLSNRFETENDQTAGQRAKRRWNGKFVEQRRVLRGFFAGDLMRSPMFFAVFWAPMID